MLTIVPIRRAEAQAFIEKHHRHRGKVTGAIFQLACANVETEKIVGVAIVGRPVARHLDDGWTVEVNRCCTDDTRNACSMLYSAAWRAAKALGVYQNCNLYPHNRIGSKFTWCRLEKDSGNTGQSLEQ